MVNNFIFTEEGFEKLKKEKENLLKKRPEAVQNLKTAREMGDLSENAAYSVAKQQLSAIDSRLRHLEKLIRFGKVSQAHLPGIISIGSKVTLKINESIVQMEIVGSYESDPMSKKISYLSPVGKALMGKRPNDQVFVETPNGIIKYIVQNIK